MSASAIEDGHEFPTEETNGTQQRLFVAVIERGEDGWGAYVPDLPGVVAAAATEEEVRDLIAEAVEFHLDGLRDLGEVVPEPSSTVTWVSG